MAQPEPRAGAKLREAESHFQAGRASLIQGRAAEAAASLERGLGLAPDDADARTNLGTAYQLLGRLDAAIAEFRRALAIRPAHAEAGYNLGNALRAAGASAEAIEWYERALALRPDLLDARINRANALTDIGRLDEAERALRDVLAERPDHAEAHKNLGHLLLLGGRLAEGWREYAWRWRAKSFGTPRRDFARPQWEGEALGGRRLLVHAEQGLGDTIQFCRYLPRLVADARVIVEVPRALVRLIGRMPGLAAVAAAGEPLPEFDLHCPLLELPRLFDTALDAIPADIPYLSADPAECAAWAARLVPKGPRIGLAWAGSPRHPNDRNRSIPLDAFTPLIEQGGASWHMVQTEPRAGDAESLARTAALARHDAELADLADAAALLDCMDLVISVDTAPAHLAAALARPVWILLPHAPDWRWMLARGDSPWYPTARLLRQDRPGDWGGVIERLRVDLRAWLAGRPTG